MNDMERRRQIAVKSTSRSSARPFRYGHKDAPSGSRKPATNGSHNNDDDDIMIIDDYISDAVREDFEKALRPVSSNGTTVSTVSKSPASSKPLPSNETPKLAIDSVRNITRSEYQRLRDEGQSATVIQPIETQTRTEQVDLDSDSDLEILEEHIIPQNSEQQAPPKVVALKSVPGPIVHQLPSGIHLITNGSSSVAVAPPPSLPICPVLQRAPMPPSMPPLHRPILPAPVMQRPPAPVASTSVTSTSVMNPRSTNPPYPPFSSLQRIIAPIQERLLKPTPPAQPRLAPGHRVNAATLLANVHQRQAAAANSQTSSIKPIFYPPALTTTTTTRMPGQPSGITARGSDAPPSALAFARAATVLRPAPPRVPDTVPLPIFGQNYMGARYGRGSTDHLTRSNVQKAQLSFQKRRSAKRRSSWSSSSYAGSSGSNDSDKLQILPTKRVSSGKLAFQEEKKASGMPKRTNLVQFPKGYYGRLRSITRNSPVNDSDAFDGLFQCGICKKVLANNISFVNHMYAHMLHPSVEDEDLNDQTKCLACWRHFGDPFKLTNHVEEVHGKREVDSVCYICEISFDDDSSLEKHMDDEHYGREMPYHCRLCRYRSSLYDDIWNHFLLEHKNTTILMCPLCLWVMEAGITVQKYDSTLSAARTESFAQHVWKHMRGGNQLSCPRCKLQFVSRSDLNNHQRLCHRQLRPSEAAASRTSSGILELKWDGTRPLTEIESDERRLVSRRLLHETMSSARFTVAEADCIECGRPMDNSRHYSKHLKKCDQCPYGTYCVTAFACHKSSVHRDQSQPPLPFEYSLVRVNRPPVLRTPAECACGHRTVFGNRIADHVASCPDGNGQSLVNAVARRPSRSQNSDEMLPSGVLAALELQLRIQDSDVPVIRREEPSTSHTGDQQDVIPKTAASSNRMLERRDLVRSPEPTTPAGSLHRPRLLSPRISKKRSTSQPSIVDEGIVSSPAQKRDKKSPPELPPFINETKLGRRLFIRYEAWERKSEMAEAEMKAACEAAQKKIDAFRSEQTKEDLYNILLQTQMPTILQPEEAKPSTSKARGGAKKAKKKKR